MRDNAMDLAIDLQELTMSHVRSFATTVPHCIECWQILDGINDGGSLCIHDSPHPPAWSTRIHDSLSAGTLLTFAVCLGFAWVLLVFA
jgi:hypothetical protein